MAKSKRGKCKRSSPADPMTTEQNTAGRPAHKVLGQPILEWVPQGLFGRAVRMGEKNES